MEKNASITAGFIWTFDEVKARQKALTAHSGSSKGKPGIWTWLFYLFLAAVIFFFLIQFISTLASLPFEKIQNNLAYVLPFPLLFVVFWVSLTVSKSQNLKRSFLESPDHDKRISVTFASDEIVMTSAGIYEMKWAWAALLEVRRTPKGFCFLQAPRSGFWVPLHAFQSQNDIEAVSEMAGRSASKFVATEG